MNHFKSALHRLFQPAADQRLVSWLFLRLLALVYLAAFASLSVQITGLVGETGILPLDEHFSLAAEHYGKGAWVWFPSIFWITGASDLALKGVSLLGILLSLLLLLGHRERLNLILLFLLYLSLYHAGQIFTNFQWDTLLLEAGFLAIFLVGGGNLLLIFLFDWLLFRLRFMSGVFKLVSGDPSWSGLTALNHYFETQPLPHIGAWYAHQLPELLLKAGVILTLFSELLVPFLIFFPRRFRYTAAAITLLMQLLIIATSNHNFINLLTIILCLFLLHDPLLKRVVPTRLLNRIETPESSPGRLRTGVIVIVTLLILPASLISFTNYLLRPPVLPQSLLGFSQSVQRLGIGHIFHVFPTMQTQRQELVIQGSNDGKTWQVYEFGYKPGDPSQAPAMIIPHQPRLDWMVWFVPTQQGLQMEWFGRFLQRLHQGSATVSALLDHNPFPDTPPRYLRVDSFKYSFTTAQEREQNGNWWKTEYLGQFPQVTPRRP
ncbi:lipase maturation factor family protein [Candidatus Thiodiazotropha sp. CDECU1]|uniref:lipase maturation factor family protein n=1 Tax=Candidatus Thiodiazotropha sp. CDECU1 TaxID=3065865 RepID=UPI00292FE9D9|nr:lipase maturation factor family protein [Candidatus Thiodiazotropha sp. CDECU1]